MSEPETNSAPIVPAGSNPAQQEPRTVDPEATPGPNLKLYYSLIAFALLAAIALAAMIVLPFYNRR
jgi:hypothetical protein